MKIVLTSQSAIKIAAVQKVFGSIEGVEIIPVAVPSGVPEQPVGDQTLRGALCRIYEARQITSGVYLYISIESGLFNEKPQSMVDKAVIVVSRGSAQPIVEYSEAVQFPLDMVHKAFSKGFDQHTVGRLMQEEGMIKNHADPHICLTGKSREGYIAEALEKVKVKIPFDDSARRSALLGQLVSDLVK